MNLLYRGVSKKLDTRLNGLLVPKGSKAKVVPRYDGKITYDETFTYGESEDNTVRGQHIETSLYGGCYISTTKKVELAVLFATHKFSEDGWVYVLDSSLFDKFGVTSKEFPDPLYPDEFEVSIRASDCGHIPSEVIVNKYEVNSNGETKT